MRSSKSRSRNKQNRQRSLGNIVNRVFDSSGPEGKVRGTPQQIIDKYLALARDAQLSSDRVAEQSFLQHAEHYTRMLSEAQREMAERQQQQQQAGQQRGEGGGDDQPRQRDGDDRRRDEARGDGQPETRGEPAEGAGLPSGLPPAREVDDTAAEALPEAGAAADEAGEAATEAKPRPRRAPRTSPARPRSRKPAAANAPDEAASGD